MPSPFKVTFPSLEQPHNVGAFFQIIIIIMACFREEYYFAPIMSKTPPPVSPNPKTAEQSELAVYYEEIHQVVQDSQLEEQRTLREELEMVKTNTKENEEEFFSTVVYY